MRLSLRKSSLGFKRNSYVRPLDASGVKVEVRVRVRVRVRVTVRMRHLEFDFFGSGSGCKHGNIIVDSRDGGLVLFKRVVHLITVNNQ